MTDAGFDKLSDSALFLSDEHRALRDQLRRFVNAEIKPHALAWEGKLAAMRAESVGA